MADNRLISIIYRVAKMLVALLESEMGCGKQQRHEITVVRVEKTVDFAANM